MIGGIAIAAKAIKPGIEIFGVQTLAYPSMYDVVKGADLPCSGQSMAEGIAVKAPGEITRKVVAEHVRDIFLVREDEIEHAVAQLLEIEKTVVEGAGAAAFAAVLGNPDVFKGRKVGVVLSGGNIDMRLLSNVILREMTREGRMFFVSIEIDDKPPACWRESRTLIGETGGNILDVNHNRMIMESSAKSAMLRPSHRGPRQRPRARDPARIWKARVSRSGTMSSGRPLKCHPGQAMRSIAPGRDPGRVLLGGYLASLRSSPG